MNFFHWRNQQNLWSSACRTSRPVPNSSHPTRCSLSSLSAINSAGAGTLNEIAKLWRTTQAITICTHFSGVKSKHLYSEYIGSEISIVRCFFRLDCACGYEQHYICRILNIRKIFLKYHNKYYLKYWSNKNLMNIVQIILTIIC